MPARRWLVLKNFFRKVGGNFLRFRKGEISVEIFDVSARESFRWKFLTCPQERVFGVDVGVDVVEGVVE